MAQTRAVTKAEKNVPFLRPERARAYAQTTRKRQTSNAVQSKENIQKEQDMHHS